MGGAGSAMHGTGTARWCRGQVVPGVVVGTGGYIGGGTGAGVPGLVFLAQPDQYPA